MKNITMIAILVLLSFVMVSSVASAQDGQDIIVIYPTRWDSSQTVYSDQWIVFASGWGACHHGNVQSYLTASYLEFILDGQLLFASQDEVSQYWGPIFQVPAGPSATACMGKTPEMIWRADWSYDYGYLEAGDHTLRFINKVDHPVTDAADYDGDGNPDLFKGILRDMEITIHVEDR